MERITYNDIPEGMFDHLRAIEGFIAKSTIDMKLIELIRLLVAQKNGCAYCVDMHYKLLKYEGETELRLASLCVWEETPYFTEKERAVLRFTEVVNSVGKESVLTPLFNLLLEYFTKREISYLTLIIAQINTWVSLMKVCNFTPGHYKVTE